MTTITLEEARLIIKRWAESSALLLVATSEQPGDVLGRFSVVETTAGGVLFRSVGGDTQVSLDLSHYETTCSYSSLGSTPKRKNTKDGFPRYRTPRTNIMSRVFLLCARYRTTTSRGVICTCGQSCIDRARLMRTLAGEIQAHPLPDGQCATATSRTQLGLVQDLDVGQLR